MTSAIENWAEVIGMLISMENSSGAINAQIAVESVDAVDGYPMLIGDTKGREIKVLLHAQAQAAASLLNHRVKLRVKLAGPGRYVAVDAAAV
jgi:hypothetical protein